MNLSAMLAKLGSFLRTLFGFTRLVDRRTYALVGFSLMAVKLGGDQLILHAATGRFWHPLDLLSLLSLMDHREVPSWTVQALGLWALPFAWIGLSMSTRRAIDAGATPWLGLLFCVPLVNLVLMLALCLPPSDPRPMPDAPLPGAGKTVREHTLTALGSAVLLSMMVFGVSIVALEKLGFVLFAASPLAMGAVVGFVLNRAERYSTPLTLGVAAAAVIAGSFLLVLFAVEGVICLAMALPLTLALACFGALIGRAAALWRPHSPSPTLWMLAVLPLLAWAEPELDPMRRVTTQIVIDAPAEEVWRSVIDFEPLPEPREWLFQLGVAYPTRARIEGSGVGAVRYCEFSTGAFVEPITAWEAPRRLAFDVVEQPEPLRELSPYRNLHLDHLDGTLASRRGEFLLTERSDGTTVLQGTTWYELSLAPEAYWSLWTDEIIRRIHLRVLRHVAAQAEGRGDQQFSGSEERQRDEA